MDPETTPRWGYHFVMPAGMYDDVPFRDSTLEHNLVSAREMAAADGYTLLGDPESRIEPLVFLPDWGEDGGIIGLDLARAVGYEGDATAYGYLLEWRAERAPAEGTDAHGAHR
jgi:hypothetical protein